MTVCLNAKSMDNLLIYNSLHGFLVSCLNLNPPRLYYNVMKGSSFSVLIPIYKGHLPGVLLFYPAVIALPAGAFWSGVNFFHNNDIFNCD